MSAFLSGRTSLTTVETGDIAAGAITTAKIAANNIDSTLTKDALIADYTEVTIATGDSLLLGDVGDSGNTKRDTVQGLLDLAGGGAWEFVSEVVASGSSTISFTGLTTGFDYKLVCSNVVNSTDLVPDLVFGTGGTPTYQTSGYNWSSQGDAVTTGAADSAIQIMGTSSVGGAGTDENWSADIIFIDPAADFRPWLQCLVGFWDNSGTSRTRAQSTIGSRTTTDIVTAIQLGVSTGDFTTGDFRLYRRTHS
jgi:hypothetical protein